LIFKFYINLFLSAPQQEYYQSRFIINFIIFIVDRDVMINNQDKKRIGLLLPSSNTVQEQEFSCILNNQISFHSARLTLRNVDLNSTIHILDELERAVQSLCDSDVDIIVFGLTAPSSRHGIGYDLQLKKRIEDLSGKPAITASSAAIDALKALHCDNLAFCAPWDEDVNSFAVSFLTNNGFEVPITKVLGIRSNLEIGRLKLSVAYNLGLEVDRPNIQAIMLACGNWASMGIINDLESVLKKPVLTTNQVSLWATLKALNVVSSLPGYGVLLSDHLVSHP